MYDYKKGKQRVKEILKNDLEIIDKDKLPKSDDLTFENSYYSWISSIFIDICDSSILFKNENNQDISKIIKSFTSELIEILRNNDNLREVGIRGDCVYAIYTTPTQKDDDDLFTLACYCNTYLIMLNELLAEYNLPSIKAGIGLATSKLLVIKAGRKHVGINDKIWIGNAVVDASNFSSIANRKGYRSIVMSVPFYKNIIKYEKDIKENLVKAESDYGDCYMGNIIITDFKNWIKNGMKN